MIRGAVAAVALAIALPAPAGAEPVRHPEDRWELELPESWTRRGDDQVWANPDTGQQLVVHRIDGPGTPAWRGRKDFFDGIEAGVSRTASGYKRLKRSTGKVGRVPTMDLWFRYDAADGAEVTVAMRYLFFRRYAVVLAVDTPRQSARRHRRGTRHLLRSFRPWFPPEPE